jgi:CheY-like chemotaxis protein
VSARVARVLALIPDLLFGSRLQGSLAAAGHEVTLTGDPGGVREQLPGADVLVVDLTREELDGAALIEALRAGGLLDGARTLGFYAHVDAAARERAERAGFDLVVPRSRLAREGPALLERLGAGP